MTIKVPHRLYLTEDQIPQQWYNLRADMKEQAAPMINPATGKPAAVEDLYPVFCKELPECKCKMLCMMSFENQQHNHLNNENAYNKHPRHHIFFFRFPVKK